MKTRLLFLTAVLCIILSGFVFPNARMRVAVVAFDDLRGNADTLWIGTALSETIMSDLTRVRSITVIDRSEIDRALESYHKTVELYKLDGTTGNELASIYGNIANIHADLGDYRSAAELCRQALDIHALSGNRSLAVAVTHENLAYCLPGLGDRAGAKENFLAARELYQVFKRTDRIEIIDYYLDQLK